MLLLVLSNPAHGESISRSSASAVPDPACQAMPIEGLSRQPAFTGSSPAVLIAAPDKLGTKEIGDQALTDSSCSNAKPGDSSIFLSASWGPPMCWMPFRSSSSQMPTSPTMYTWAQHDCVDTKLRPYRKRAAATTALARPCLAYRLYLDHVYVPSSSCPDLRCRAVEDFEHKSVAGSCCSRLCPAGSC